MATLRRRFPRAHAAVLAALALTAGCEAEGDADRAPGAVVVDGVRFDVLALRPLEPGGRDERLLAGEEPAGPGERYLGLFVRACNVSDRSRWLREDFALVDADDRDHRSQDLPERNRAAFDARRLPAGRCLPARAGLRAGRRGALVAFEVPARVLTADELAVRLPGQDRDDAPVVVPVS